MVEDFVDQALHHAYFGLNHAKIRATWEITRATSFSYEMKQKVMSGAWHRGYLAEVPKILNELSLPVMALSALSERRRAFVQPRLTARGFTPASWAKAAGVDASVVYDYLAGKSNPRAENRRALAGALGIEPGELP